MAEPESRIARRPVAMLAAPAVVLAAGCLCVLVFGCASRPDIPAGSDVDAASRSSTAAAEARMSSPAPAVREDLEVEDAIPVRGRVEYPASEGVPGDADLVRLVTLRWRPTAPSQRQAADAVVVVDRAGAFQVRLDASSWSRLAVYPLEARTADGTVVFEGCVQLDESVVVPIPSRVRLRGALVHPDKSPATGRLRIWQHDEPMAVGETDRQGRFCISAPRAGAGTLVVEVATDVPARATFTLEVARAVLTKDPGPTLVLPERQIDVHVSSPRGSPVAGAVVRALLQPAIGGEPRQVAAVTDVTGTARLWVQHGSLDGLVHHEQYSPTPLSLPHIKDVVEVVLDTRGSFLVEGLVEDEGATPVPGASVAVYPACPDLGLAKEALTVAEADADGRFRVPTCVDAGHRLVQVWRPGAGTFHPVVVDRMVEGEPLHIVLPTVRRVEFVPSGLPASGRAVPAAPSYCVGGVGPASSGLLYDGSGCAVLPVGAHRVAVRFGDHMGVCDFFVAAGEGVQRVVVPLRPARTIRGWIDAADEPLYGTVTACDEVLGELPACLVAPVVAAGSGEFEIAIPAGSSGSSLRVSVGDRMAVVDVTDDEEYVIQIG